LKGLPKRTCVHCGHVWRPRKEYQKHCPNIKCQSVLWEGKRLKSNTHQAITAKRVTDRMIGLKFNNLTVIKHLNARAGYLCQCDCGNNTIAKSSQLKSGRHASCGCLPRKTLPDDKAAKRDVFRNYRQAAKKRGYIFSIEENYFFDLIVSPCVYCAVPSSMGTKPSKHKEFRFNGVDRVDNSLGYTNENCVSCCKHCNRSKASMKVDDWHSWLTRVSSSDWFKSNEAKLDSCG
jgi:hypothetical protein